MFAPFVALLPIVLASFTTAAPALSFDITDSPQCTSGELSCCSNTLTPENAQGPLGQLGLGHLLDNLSGQVGLQCNAITGIGTGQGATCTQEPVCCAQNNYNGLVNLGCTPVNAAA
ncbi:hydrophobin [Coniophora puteana RWD-64-598 SS2]|uniref:Hydrophobin n=1 Tax=Coniophora puteana (strain RWD-64-598) TaxID=741705 RepID=A0A5M3ME16_CONPW|nr:hydrophobin [Coniophora puteana RWD-64-598 SS2]EIW77383.1 hydrophobin [Coniophora puteana RWD-64-598 SS2]